MILDALASSQPDIFNILIHLLFAHFLDILINYLLLHLLPQHSYPLHLSQVGMAPDGNPISCSPFCLSAHPLSDGLSQPSNSPIKADVVEDVPGHPLEPGIVRGELELKLV